jgi:two-component sensor histidine kinase
MNKRCFLLLFLVGLSRLMVMAQRDTATRRLLARGESALSAAQDLKQQDKFAAAVPYLKKAEAIFGQTHSTADLIKTYCLRGAVDTSLEVREAYYEKALGLLKTNGDKQGIAAVLPDYSEVKMMQGQLPAAEEMLQESIRLSKELGIDRLQWQYGLLGAVQIQRRESVEALKNELQAIKIGEQYGDTSSRMAEIYNYAAIIYMKMGRLEESGEYLRKAIATGSHSQGPMLAVQFRSNLANILIRQNKPKDALEDLLVLEKRYGNEMPLNARIQMLSRFVRCYTELGDLAKAGRYADELIKYSDGMKPDAYDQLALYTELNRYLIASRQYAKARRFVDQMRMTAEKIDLPDQRTQACYYRFEIDSATGDMASALHYFQLYTRIKDSTNSVNISNQLNQLHVEYETEKKDKELLARQKNIELLRKSNRIQEMELERAAFIRNVIIAGALGLALMSALVYSRYRMKKRASEELALQREEIRQKNLDLQALVSDKDKLLAEKEWLMKEVHHRVKNNLQMVISLLNSQSAYLSSEDAVAAIKESQRRMHAMSLIHQRLYEKDEATVDMPTYISDLVDYLKDSFDSGHVKFALDLHPLVLDVSKAVPVGLILNEAITNALKYAFPDGQAGHILVSLKSRGPLVELIVADDGIGFPTNDRPASKKSLGMSLIKGLTDQIGGRYEIVSQGGVEMVITFPVTE